MHILLSGSTGINTVDRDADGRPTTKETTMEETLETFVFNVERLL